MAASFPGAIKSFSAVVNGVTKLVAALFNSPYDEITAIETELGTDPAGSVSDVKTRLAVSLNNDGTIKNAAVFQAALKTATGEVSHASGTSTNYTLPGGEYGFYPQIKTTDTSANYEASILYIAGTFATGPSTSYVTNIRFRTASGSYTIYAQQRYVTASGQDHWLFLLIDKVTKEIIGSYSAPDHPAYGNGGNFDKMPHPFGPYDEIKYEIILIDNNTIEELKAQVTPEKSLLTLVNEAYKVNMTQEEIYKPLHSGRFLGQKPELIEVIPPYVKVRKLIKLSNAEKQDKGNKQQLAIQKVEQEKQKKSQSRLSAENKLGVLGLTKEEIETLR